MSLLQSMILGLLQGFTEFLPVSSSGHLVLTGALLKLEEPHLLFDIVLHGATLLATIFYYRKSLLEMVQAVVPAFVTSTKNLFGDKQARDLALIPWRTQPHLQLCTMIILGTLPTGIIGVVFKKQLEALFDNPKQAAIMLLVTAAILLSTRWVKDNNNNSSNTVILPWQALLIGTIQGLAIIPGISRSGSTIACALLLGIERETAARYSFLLSLPAIAGALVLQIAGEEIPTIPVIPTLAGFITALIVGIGALYLFIPIVKKGKLYLFAGYLMPLGLTAMICL